jgi:hypothetical protein
MNFFVRAVEDPNLIVNALSVYSNITESVDHEIFDICYYAKQSFFDVSLMNFLQRRFWIKAINKKHEANKPDNVINAADLL